MEQEKTNSSQHVYIRDLIAADEDLIGTPISGVYYCKSCQLISRGNKKKFYSLVLSDKTGDISAKIHFREVGTAIQGSRVEISGFLSLFNGKPMVELDSVRVVNPDIMSESRQEQIESELVCRIPNTLVTEYAWKIRHVIDALSVPYRDCILSFFSKNVFGDLSGLPATNHGPFSYNGGLLDKLVLSLDLAESLFATQLPESVYPAVLPNKDICIMGILCICVCQCGKYAPMPDGTENRLTGGYHYLGMILQSLQAHKDVDSERVINCIRFCLEDSDYGVSEARICKQILALADEYAYLSYADFAGIPTIIKKKGSD